MSEERKQIIRAIMEKLKELDSYDLMMVNHMTNGLYASEQVHGYKEANHG